MVNTKITNFFKYRFEFETDYQTQNHKRAQMTMIDQYATTTSYSGILDESRFSGIIQDGCKASIDDEVSSHALFVDFNDCTGDGAVSRIKELVTRSFILGCVKFHSSKVLAERRIAKQSINAIEVESFSGDTVEIRTIHDDQAKYRPSISFLGTPEEKDKSCLIIQDEDIIHF